MKPPVPSIEIDDISPEEFMQFPKEELDKIPYDLVRWQCKVKFCKCYTRLRNYSILPMLYGPRMEGSKWINMFERFFMCSKHWKRYKGRHYTDIPLKKDRNGNILQGYDDTKKETIIY